uniref:Uncharacterized protein n=1 Tax=Octopus bimaculoides TaxID=37653 RepID=A0A0L8HKH9_OCTBM
MAHKCNDYVADVSILERTKSSSIEANILKHRLRQAGRVARMNETRLPRQIVYSELSTGRRVHDSPHHRYKDQLGH